MHEHFLTDMNNVFHIMTSLDADFVQAICVSLRISLMSVFLAACLGLPTGVFLATHKFVGRNCLVMVINTLMSMPTVVVGLLVYSFLSRQGPLGSLGLLYTQTAMVIGQVILAFPIMTSLTITSVQTLDGRIQKTLLSFGASSRHTFFMIIHESRYGLMAALIAGFGRVFAEIGVSMMLGGNIRGYTRNITTTIALETNKGEFALGMALGFVLLLVAFLINGIFHLLQKRKS